MDATEISQILGRADALVGTREDALAVWVGNDAVDLVDEVRRLEGENTQLRDDRDEAIRMAAESIDERLALQIAINVKAEVENTQLRTALKELADAADEAAEHFGGADAAQRYDAAMDAARVALGEN